MNQEQFKEYTRYALTWYPHLEFGYQEPEENFLSQYNDQYFDNYKQLAATPMSKELNNFRADLVNKYIGDQPCLDIGVGAGEFIRARRELRDDIYAGEDQYQTFGYDVMPKAVDMLKNELCAYADYKDMSGICMTFWDSLEHIPNPSGVLMYAGSHIFISMPIVTGPTHLLKSKHYKPNEHLWYFTEQGLCKWLEKLKYNVVEITDVETQLGREDVLTFVAEKVS